MVAVRIVCILSIVVFVLLCSPTPMYPPTYLEPGIGYVLATTCFLFSVFNEYLHIANHTLVARLNLCLYFFFLFFLSVLLILFFFFIRRHTPYGNQTDYRIFELNKRLQNWTEVTEPQTYRTQLYLKEPS